MIWAEFERYNLGVLLAEFVRNWKDALIHFHAVAFFVYMRNKKTCSNIIT